MKVPPAASANALLQQTVTSPAAGSLSFPMPWWNVSHHSPDPAPRGRSLPSRQHTVVLWEAPTPNRGLLHQLPLCSFIHCSSQWHRTWRANSMNFICLNTGEPLISFWRVEINSSISGDTELCRQMNSVYTMLLLYIHTHSVYTHVAHIHTHPLCAHSMLLLYIYTTYTLYTPCYSYKYTCNLYIHYAIPISIFLW